MLPLLFVSLLVAAADIQIGEAPPDHEKIFSEIITKAAIRLQKLSEKRPLKLAKLNDSLERTAAGARFMAQKGAEGEAWKALEEAKALYDHNSFALLLQAILKNASGDLAAANALFEQYLIQSRRYTPFDESFLKWADFHTLRRAVYHLLVSRGISFKGREREIHVQAPFPEFFAYLMDPKREDFLMNLILVIMIVGGGIFLVLAQIRGVEWSPSFPGALAMVYLFVWVAYGLWISDLAFGLPWGLPRIVVVPVFLLLTAVPTMGLEIFFYFREKNKPLAEGFRRCPHCKAPVLELSIECPECKKKI
ncbi:MAG: hypothetical protein ACOY3K_04820 [Candidatus Omnitrophota bacterium]